jgi:hypothetical protein
MRSMPLARNCIARNRSYRRKSRGEHVCSSAPQLVSEGVLRRTRALRNRRDCAPCRLVQVNGRGLAFPSRDLHAGYPRTFAGARIRNGGITNMQPQADCADSDSCLDSTKDRARLKKDRDRQQRTVAVIVPNPASVSIAASRSATNNHDVPVVGRVLFGRENVRLPERCEV